MRIGLALLAMLLASTAVQAATYEPYMTAVLQGTDKVSGHVEKITAPVGADIRFGGLYVRVHACKKTPPEELPEAVAFLEITEIQKDVLSGPPAKTWFSGWMFASNPSLAALEHPVYDIAIVDCLQPVNNDAAPVGQALPPVPATTAVTPPVTLPATNAATKAALPATVPSR